MIPLAFLAGCALSATVWFWLYWRERRAFRAFQLRVQILLNVEARRGTKRHALEVIDEIRPAHMTREQFLRALLDDDAR